jgi:uncharacterized protein YlxW (UPF0749 family)
LETQPQGSPGPLGTPGQVTQAAVAQTGGEQSLSTRNSQSNWQVPIALASIFMGILISLQFRVQSVKAQPSKQGDLMKIIKDLEEQRSKLTEELQVDRQRLNDIEQKMGKGDTEAKELKQQSFDAKVNAGLMAMKGPGLVITLSDSTKRAAPDEDIHYFIIHDVDLQTLVNELYAAGCEAISINGQRIVNRTPIRCVGPTILIDAVRIASPYVVTAIGSPDDMEGGLKMTGGFMDSMNMLIRSGGEVRVSKNQNLTVPAFTGSMTFRFAKAVTP